MPPRLARELPALLALAAMLVTVLYAHALWSGLDAGLLDGDEFQHVENVYEARQMLDEGRWRAFLLWDQGAVEPRCDRFFPPYFYPGLTYQLAAVMTRGEAPWPPTGLFALMRVFIVVLGISLYGLGRALGGPAWGVCCAWLGLTAPAAVGMSHAFYLEFPLLAWVAATLALCAARPFASLSRALLLGVVVAAGCLTKWTYPVHALVPLAFAAGGALRGRARGIGVACLVAQLALIAAWGWAGLDLDEDPLGPPWRGAQVAVAGLVLALSLQAWAARRGIARDEAFPARNVVAGLAVAGALAIEPLRVIVKGGVLGQLSYSVVDVGRLEGDPGFWEALWYYARLLVSYDFPLVYLPLLAAALFVAVRPPCLAERGGPCSLLRPLALSMLAGLLFFSAMPNKDGRFLLPMIAPAAALYAALPGTRAWARWVAGPLVLAGGLVVLFAWLLAPGFGPCLAPWLSESKVLSRSWLGVGQMALWPHPVYRVMDPPDTRDWDLEDVLNLSIRRARTLFPLVVSARGDVAPWLLAPSLQLAGPMSRPLRVDFQPEEYHQPGAPRAGLLRLLPRDVPGEPAPPGEALVRRRTLPDGSRWELWMPP